VFQRNIPPAPSGFSKHEALSNVHNLTTQKTILFFVFIACAHEFRASGAQDYHLTQIQDVEVLLHNGNVFL
jgi:hypothetical protein